ncbi:MAG: MarR family transcriptional regulator [Herpetosiphonaceae bacterium]|nr:MarR family transcriptional regulator [Herpetosiphonaceae bacterium]
MGRARQTLTEDWVDHVLAEWAQERPDLETAPVAIVARVGRLATLLDAGLAQTFKRFGLSRAGFDILATLRRSCAPYRLPQKALMQALLRTSGTVSFRIDRLERMGLVRREADPADARGVLVSLTERGEHLFDTVAPAHLANEAQLVAALTPEEQTILVALLRRLLVRFESAKAPAPRSARNRPRSRGATH